MRVDDYVHSEAFTFIILLFGRRDQVRADGIVLRQVRRKIHLFPHELLFGDVSSRKTKLPQMPSFDKINLTAYERRLIIKFTCLIDSLTFWLFINAVRVTLVCHSDLLRKCFAVGAVMPDQEGVLLAIQPSMLQREHHYTVLIVQPSHFVAQLGAARRCFTQHLIMHAEPAIAAGLALGSRAKVRQQSAALALTLVKPRRRVDALMRVQCFSLPYELVVVVLKAKVIYLRVRALTYVMTSFLSYACSCAASSYELSSKSLLQWAAVEAAARVN